MKKIKDTKNLEMKILKFYKSTPSVPTQKCLWFVCGFIIKIALYLRQVYFNN